MALITTQGSTVENTPTTIADNASLSAAVDLAGRGISAIIIPSTWVTATVITFQVSLDGSTYYDLYHNVSGTLTEYSVPVAASRYIALEQTKFFGVKFIKVRSGTQGSPVNQTADAGVELPLIVFAI